MAATTTGATTGVTRTAALRAAAVSATSSKQRVERIWRSGSRSARQRCEHTHCHVLVAGEFKQGKSSLLNALVNAPICPVDDDVATARAIEIGYADEPNGRDRDGRSERRPSRGPPDQLRRHPVVRGPSADGTRRGQRRGSSNPLAAQELARKRPAARRHSRRRWSRVGPQHRHGAGPSRC